MTIVDADTTPVWLKRAIRLALASLQRRDDIVSWLKSAVDLDNNTIKVSPGKTQGYDNPIHLQIKMGKALREVVSECMRSPVASPYLIHYRPKARRRYAIHKPRLPNSRLTVYRGISGEQFHGSSAS